MDKITPIKEIGMKTFFDNAQVKIFGTYFVVMLDFLFGTGEKVLFVAICTSRLLYKGINLV